MDLTLLRFINGLAGHVALLDAIGVFLASWLIWIELALVVLYFALRRTQRVVASACALAAALVSWLVNQGIGELWFRPRPFATLAGIRLLITKSPLEKSFPSDHATIAFAIATAVFLWNRRWGTVLLTVAALISLGRVFVGVHYPSDVLAGAVIGALIAFIIHQVAHHVLRLRYPAHK